MRRHDWIGDEPTLARDLYGWRLESTADYLTEPAYLFARGWVLLGNDGSITPTERRAA